ncbi:MAG: hypothetical protein JXA89_07455 [Anaerolineae bacterium]|nr:hypothetical protein [Anaerolineae bacterium]
MNAMHDTTERRRMIAPRLAWFVFGVLAALIVVGGLSACYQGRDVSRITGKPTLIKLPDDLASYEDILTISFHKNDKGETIKDLTYIATDGKLHSREYNDWGIFQGEIIWELQGE